MESIERALYYIVDESDDHNKLSKFFNYFLMVLIILSVGEMALETDETIFNEYKYYFNVFDLFTVMVFSAEYIIRIVTAHLNPKNKGKTRWQSIKDYIFSFAGIVDLLSILPFYVNDIKFDSRVVKTLRLFRFLRVFKMARYNESMKDIVDVIRAKSSEIGVIMGLIMIIMIISSFIMFYAEHKDNSEQFPNVLSCLWWAIVTMTTIGYGDVYPITVWGKVVGSIMAILGIGLVAMPTGIISAGFLEKIDEKKKKAEKEEAEKEKPKEEITEENKKHYCPYCGKRLD